MSRGRFKIGTLAMLSGFGIPTLRNWERRYGLLKPFRIPSGHRLYTLEDLATLRRARALLNEGRSIGEVVAIGREALLSADAEARLGEPQGEPTEIAGAVNELPAQLVLDALPSGVVVTDVRGRTLWVNRSLERICGYGLAELRGRTPGSVLQGPQTDERTARQIGEAVAHLRPCSVRILNYDANERVYWAELEIAPVLLGAEPRGFVATIRDVTDEVEARSR